MYVCVPVLVCVCVCVPGPAGYCAIDADFKLVQLQMLARRTRAATAAVAAKTDAVPPHRPLPTALCCCCCCAYARARPLQPTKQVPPLEGILHSPCVQP